MTRSDLVARPNRFQQLTQRDAEFAVKTILDAMTRHGARPPHRDPRLWQLLDQPGRRAWAQPRAGEQVHPRKAVPHFKPGKACVKDGGRPHRRAET